MKISIITVCFNSELTLEAMLQSIASQGWRDFEHIVVDGGSTDGTLALIAGWTAHPIRLVSGPDRGIYDAMNKGAAIATGEAIGFLNADDRYADPGCLGAIAAAFADPAVDFVHGDLVFVRPADRALLRYWKGAPFRRRQLRFGLLPGHPTLYVRRAAFQATGPLSLDYGTAGDVEWMIRLLARPGLRSVYLPRVLVEMNAGGASNAGWTSHLRASRHVWRACADLGLSPAAFVIGKTLSKLPQWWRRRAAS